jgi:hypothetical protein
LRGVDQLQYKKNHHERSDCDAQSYLMSVEKDAGSLPSIICRRAPERWRIGVRRSSVRFMTLKLSQTLYGELDIVALQIAPALDLGFEQVFRILRKIVFRLLSGVAYPTGEFVTSSDRGA